MLLRSSSTPVLGSLLSSLFPESPTNNNYQYHSELHHDSTQKHTPNSIRSKLSCSNGGLQDSRKSLKGTSTTGIRRVQSEGNLEELAYDELSLSKKSSRRNSCCSLEAIPSFSLHHLQPACEDDDSDDDDVGEIEQEEKDEESSRLNYTYNNSMMAENNLALEQVRSDVESYGGVIFEGEGKMYLATGLGVSGIDFGNGSGGGGGGGYRPVSFDRDGGDSQGLSMEQQYKRMLEDNPGNPLFLRNYAHFLHQVKGDVGAAEEYYSRAILADPKDGEILSQFATLTWELHRDKEGATNYFKRAVEASSEDSHVHAAYASFLWDTEEEEDEENAIDGSGESLPLFRRGIMASATA